MWFYRSFPEVETSVKRKVDLSDVWSKTPAFFKTNGNNKQESSDSFLFGLFTPFSSDHEAIFPAFLRLSWPGMDHPPTFWKIQLGDILKPNHFRKMVEIWTNRIGNRPLFQECTGASCSFQGKQTPNDSKWLDDWQLWYTYSHSYAPKIVYKAQNDSRTHTRKRTSFPSLPGLPAKRAWPLKWYPRISVMSRRVLLLLGDTLKGKFHSRLHHLSHPSSHVWGTSPSCHDLFHLMYRGAIRKASKKAAACFILRLFKAIAKGHVYQAAGHRPHVAQRSVVTGVGRNMGLDSMILWMNEIRQTQLGLSNIYIYII